MTPRGRCRGSAAPAHDGYLFAQPLDADRAEDLLASWDPTRFAAAALN